ncbi:MAG: cadherin domain-containing protein, partial [Pricia sp.]
MRKITLLSFFAFFSSLAYGQTPCSPISPLDCSEIAVSLPANLDFNSSSANSISDSNGLGTGFTAVMEHSEARRQGDLPISDPNLNGYEPSLLTLSGGQLQILSQGGIAYLDPPDSNNNNNQVNTLGVGFDALQETIVIETKLLNIVTGGNSAQAGIWFGFNEDNFVKLNVNGSNIELRVEIEGASVNGLPGQIQQNLGVSGQDVTLEMIINPSTLTVEAYHTIGAGVRTLLGNLPIPNSYFTGRDINPVGGQDNVSFAGIYATHRAGTQFTASFDAFSVETPLAPLFEAHVNFQNDPASTVPPTGYEADYGLAFGASSLNVAGDSYAYGWKEFSNGTPIDVTGNGGAGRNRIESSYAGALLQEKLEGTLVHFQGDNIGSWSGQNRGTELMWELQVPNGTYDVTVGIGDRSASTDSRHSATIEGFTIVPAFVPSPGQVKTETMTVRVSDGFLTMNGLGGFNSKITHIDVVESTGVPVNGNLVFSPAAVSPTLVVGTTGTFSSDLSGTGAGAIALTIDDNVDETGFNDWMNLPPAGLGSVQFNMDATDLAVGDTRNSSIIATAKGFTPAILAADLTVTAPASTETQIVTFVLAEQSEEATIGASSIDIEVANGTDLTVLAPTITTSPDASIDPDSEVAQDFTNPVVYTVTAEDGTTTQDWTVTVTEASLANQAPVVENQTFDISEDATIGTSIGTVVATDSDTTDLTYTITAGNDGAEFEIGASTGEIITSKALDFEAIAQYTLTVEVSDGELTDTADIIIDVTDVLETLPFEAHVNFQNSAVTPPSGYLADYGKAYGTTSVSLGADTYDFGWKRLSDGTPIDLSNEAANNSNGAGRNRIGTAYDAATDQEKLEGTLIHFQGDNVITNTGGQPAWQGQPRGIESMWELEMPNGIYEVTLGLGDKDGSNLDSRHSATVEGYTIIPAFVPNPGQTVVETMVVAVSDGFLTINGLGGFNSKITHIDVIESTDTPVDGLLSFDPAAVSETLVTGEQGILSSSLSGAGATAIGLVIDDNINTSDKNITDANDWLTLPATVTLGTVDFSIDASDLLEGDTRNNTIIATAKGFRPASLTADVSVTAVPVEAPVLVISEIMQNPAAVGDTEGEWFELYNPGTEDVDIEGWSIADNDSDAHTITNGGPLLVPAEGYLVLANNADVLTNGGKIVGYQYDGFTLANSEDEIVFVDAADNEIDRVEYDNTNFPDKEGESMALNGLTDDNNVGGNWSASDAAFGTGDFGTPGISNAGKANESPVITSVAAAEVEENQTAVLDIETTDDVDAEGAGITFAFSGGLDDALFSIDAVTGVVSFLNAPDFESPADDGGDNIYDLQITATDSGGLIAAQNIAVTVTDVDETVAFEAHINFQNNPASTPPPVGYLADYGK